LVYEKNNNVANVGFLFAAICFPEALISFYSSQVAAKRSLKKSLAALEMFRFLVALAIAAVVYCNVSPLILIGIHFLGSFGDALAVPLSNTALTSLSQVQGRKSSLSSRFEMASQLGNVLSLALGSILVSRFSSYSLLATSAVFYLFSALCIVGSPALNSPEKLNCVTEKNSEPAKFVTHRKNHILSYGIQFASMRVQIVLINMLMVPLFVKTYSGKMEHAAIADGLLALGMVLAGAGFSKVQTKFSNENFRHFGFFIVGVCAFALPYLSTTSGMILLFIQAFVFGLSRISLRQEISNNVSWFQTARFFAVYHAVGLVSGAVTSVLVSVVFDKYGASTAFQLYGFIILCLAGLAYFASSKHSNTLSTRDTHTKPKVSSNVPF
jgi:MFS family permease